MNATSIYPVLMSDDVPAAAGFWQDTFGFETTFSSDWYVSLRRDAWELALLDPGHTTVPQTYRDTAAAGLLVNLEVDDVDAEWDRLRERHPVILPIRSEPFGQRHFILAGHDRVLVDVITPIPPDPAFLDSFT